MSPLASPPTIVISHAARKSATVLAAGAEHRDEHRHAESGADLAAHREHGGARREALGRERGRPCAGQRGDHEPDAGAA